MRRLLILAGLILLGGWALVPAQTDLSEGWEVQVMRDLQPPQKIMDTIGVKPGMVIGEVGAGRGRFTVYLARQVGPTGKLYANDIDRKSLDYLQARCQKLGFKQVEIIRGENDDPLLPRNALDMAIMVWTFHMIEKPDLLLKNLKSCLKPGAPLVIIDPIDSEIDGEFHIDRSKPGPHPPTIRERVEKSARAAGYELLKVETFLPKDYIFILKPAGPPK